MGLNLPIGLPTGKTNPVEIIHLAKPGLSIESVLKGCANKSSKPPVINKCPGTTLQWKMNFTLGKVMR
ncbi:hypothetical protein BPUTEOMOX_704 [methanotrophic endosymbiont of Bathymodiolus puteoserpentis (Logatchev)]|jgi:hypothetical protein|nr:hypothetical protein BPUTEOMOX_704 [methanotrophic endosymbiont of Bathymodiolus puteoserpentis (Logatchev)]